MKSRHWFVLICYVALASVASSQVTQEQRAPRDSTRQAQQNQRGTDSLPVSVKLLNSGKTEAELQQDSAQQAEAARIEQVENTIADKALTIAIIALVVAGFQAVLFVWQNTLTREAISHSELTAQRQLRAYMGIDGMTPLRDAPPPGLQGGLLLKIKNFGATPAHAVTVTVKLGEVAKAGDPLEPIEARADASVSIYHPTGDQSVRVDHWLRDPKKPVAYLYGEIRYRDAFNLLCEVDFKYVWLFGVSRLEMCPDGNRAEYGKSDGPKPTGVDRFLAWLGFRR